MKLPEGWEEVELFKYLELVTSGVKRFSGMKNYIDTGSLETGKIKDFVKVNYETRPSRANMEVQENDILFAKMKDTEKVYLISKDDVDNIYSTGFGILRVKNKSKVVPKYAYFWLRTKGFQNLKNKESTGATQKAINETKLKRFTIVIPPFKTQQKIVSILEKAEKLKEWREEANKVVNDFLKSTFLNMFGDPVYNPIKWEKVRTIEVADCIVPGRDKPKSFTGNIPWVTTDDLSHLGITFCSKKGMGLKIKEVKQVRAKIIPRDSVLVTCVGDLGMTSIVGKDMVINQQLHSFQCSKKVNNIFLMFNLSFQKPYMFKMATSTTVPYMNKTICNNIPTILPPIELQNKFASIVKKVENIKENQKHSKQLIDDLFNSLMKKAFRGELEC
jgi:type I restriction enzyme S subunit